jgi:hypothetical protein
VVQMVLSEYFGEAATPSLPRPDLVIVQFDNAARARWKRS